MGKYIKNNNEIGHCPSCRGVLFRDVKFEDSERKIFFKMRCPHCQKYTKVTIDLSSGKIIINDNG